MGLVVGVDLATAEVRALVVDGAGTTVAEARRSLAAPVSPRPGWWEQDAGSWWPATAGALREVTGRLGHGAVDGVSVCATSGTVVALDGGGSPLGPALLYSDQRATAEAETAQEAGDDRWAGLGLRVRASFGLPKWAWLLHAPGSGGGGVRRLAHASDVVVAALVGGPVATDWSHALKSGYDPRREEWAGEAMAALGIDPALLPEVRPPASVAGEVGAAAAAATGLAAGTPVRLGMTDACASQLAAGAARPGQGVSVLGSTLVLKGVSTGPVADPAGAVYSHRHPDGWWLPGGASSTGGRALTAGFPDRDLVELDRRAARHGPAAAVAYPLVGRGERFPFARPDAEGFVLGGAAGEV
ncbi:MAG TPA: FGGY family carbohydrate kinase, partial [Acidimicrobiales bacterium]|nr:FGGY family carbohydrate kinase [Acidimicrobiales bacterium]